jgi:hypothetical protein
MLRQYTYVVGMPNAYYKNRGFSITVVADSRESAEFRAINLLWGTTRQPRSLAIDTIWQTPVIEHGEDLESIELR